MIKTVFVTGAGGFVGRALVRQLTSRGDLRVKILARRAPAPGTFGPAEPELVIGDLLSPSAYEAHLAGVDAIIHLAATTGRADKVEYERVNVEGTRLLLQAAKAQGVRRFLHVSTIAAGYANKRYYPYAVTKAQSEALVAAAGIDFTILRPTIILGATAASWLTLDKIAGLPVIPLPQGRAPVMVQPIHLDDVVRGLEQVLQADRFQGETFDLGGPAPLSLAAFLAAIHRAKAGKTPAVVPIPLAPIRLMLALAEPLKVLPFTAGQFALFANDSAAAPSWLADQLAAQMPATEATIARLAEDPPAGPRPPVVKPPLRQPDPAARAKLGEEADRFSRYLVGAPASDYLRDHYARANFALGLDLEADAEADRAVLDFAGQGPLQLKAADAYCVFFFRGSALRRKLVLMAAILEHAAPSDAAFEPPPRTAPITVAARMFAYCAAFGLSLLVGVAALGPKRLGRRPASAAA
jgi:nucleoside-diphosphate-sugar epimerase